MPTLRLQPLGMGSRQIRSAVTVAVGDFGMGALCGAFKQDSASLARSLTQAIRYYLADQEAGRPGWAYPRFHRDDEPRPTVKVPIEIDQVTWEALAAEADRQEVSTDQLLQHAVLYFVADRDSGRVARRIVEGLSGREP